jgi:hypothetical protein
MQVLLEIPVEVPVNPRYDDSDLTPVVLSTAIMRFVGVPSVKRATLPDMDMRLLPAHRTVSSRDMSIERMTSPVTGLKSPGLQRAAAIFKFLAGHVLHQLSGDSSTMGSPWQTSITQRRARS